MEAIKIYPPRGLDFILFFTTPIEIKINRIQFLIQFHQDDPSCVHKVKKKTNKNPSKDKYEPINRFMPENYIEKNFIN